MNVAHPQARRAGLEHLLEIDAREARGDARNAHRRQSEQLGGPSGNGQSDSVAGAGHVLRKGDSDDEKHERGPLNGREAAREQQDLSLIHI